MILKSEYLIVTKLQWFQVKVHVFQEIDPLQERIE